jgi:molybdate transport system ATP-binding protein
MLDAHVVKTRPEFTVDVRLRLRRGACLAIFGASGAGKSTVLSCIAGIETPDGGAIRFADTTFFPPALPLNERPLAYLTQKDLLFPHLSVSANVCFGLEAPTVDGAARWVDELKGRLGLGPIWSAAADRISGGQARRVALARMLVRRPPLVLLDEPFVALDRPMIKDLTRAIAEWQRTIGFTLIAVDHRREILERLCPHAIVIERGRVVQEGAWGNIAAAPATSALARLLAPD